MSKKTISNNPYDPVPEDLQCTALVLWGALVGAIAATVVVYLACVWG
jgi:hypothetical protein